MDAVSETRLGLVAPELAARVQAMYDELAAGSPSIHIRVTQGLRTKGEQDALYAQGRSAPGNVVTRARGGYSAHNFGLAVDCCPDKVEGLTWSPDWDSNDERYAAMVAAGERQGLICGANWHSIKDEPHFQLAGFPVTPTDAMRSDLGAGIMRELVTIWGKAGQYGG